MLKRIKRALLMGSMVLSLSSPIKADGPVVENNLENIVESEEKVDAKVVNKDKPVSFKVDAYGTNKSLGLDVELESRMDHIIWGLDLHSAFFDNHMNLREATLRFVALTDNWFIGGQAGVYGPTELLRDVVFGKFQLGTKPEKHYFNFHAGAIYLRAPNIKYEVDAPSNMFGVNAGMNYRPVVHFEKAMLRFNLDSNLSLFWQPFIPDKLNEFLNENEREVILARGIGDPAIFAFSHWKTVFDTTLQTKYFDISLLNDVDLMSTIIHNHRLDTKLKYKNINLGYGFGARFFHSIYTDVVVRPPMNQIFWDYGDRTDLISTVNINYFLSNNLNFRGYAEINHSNKYLNRYVISVMKKANEWNFDVYGMYDCYRNNFSAGVMATWNFDEVFNPDKYNRWHYPAEPVLPSLRGDLNMLDARLLHEVYGPTLSSAIEKIHNYQDLSTFVKHFHRREVRYGFENPERVYMEGSSNCEGINGSLIPYVVKRALGLEAGYTPVIQPGEYHVIAWVKNKRETYDIWDYGDCYETNERDLKRAIERAFPGTILTRDGVMPVVEKTRKLLEENLYNDF